MNERDTLLGQVLAANLLLVTLTLFGASVAAGLDLTIEDQRWQFLVLAMAVILTLLVNILMLRRRFAPLERLIERVERIDPAQPSGNELSTSTGLAEVDRLEASFGRLLERVESEQRRSAGLVLRAQERERKRLARDLHDEVNQALTAILLRLQALSQEAPSALVPELAETKRLVTRAMEQLLGLARQLRPAALDDHGLGPAIEGQLRVLRAQTGIEARLETTGDLSQVPEDGQVIIYRVAQEALANVARHALARHTTVSVVADGGVEMRVRDDGRGFDPARASRRGGLGLDGMAERARLAGGELSIESSPGEGTLVKLVLP